MSIKTVFVEDKKIAEKIVHLARNAGMVLNVNEVHRHYVTDFTNNLPYDEKFIVESCVMETLGHVMSNFTGNYGNQSCSCGAEWRIWYSATGLERKPLNELAENHI